MAATPSALTSQLRKSLFPALKAHAFSPIKPRIAYRISRDSTCILSYRCVGSHFSSITRFPALSLTVTAGMYFPAVPNPFGLEGSLDKNGLPTSMEVTLSMLGDISKQPRRGQTKPEATRRDVWWLEPDGSNLEAAVADIVMAVTDQAMPWYSRWESLDAALESSLSESREYPGKTWRIYCLAKQLGRSDILSTYRPLLEKQWPKTYELVA